MTDSATASATTTATVTVTLKPSIFDPQGEAIGRALRDLGFDSIDGVRIGKYIELQISGTRDDAAQIACRAADALLANPVLETWDVEVTP